MPNNENTLSSLADNSQCTGVRELKNNRGESILIIEFSYMTLVVNCDPLNSFIRRLVNSSILQHKTTTTKNGLVLWYASIINIEYNVFIMTS